MYKYHSSLD